MDNKNEKKGRDEILKKYEYLDELSLNGYLWEFIRRNKEYKKAYEQYQKKKNHWLEPVYDPPKNKNEAVENWYIRTHGRIFPRNKLLFNPFGLEYPLDPSRQANDMPSEHPTIDNCFKLTNTSVFHYFVSDPEVRKLWNQEWLLSHKYGIEVLIDVTAPLDKIKEKVEKIVRTERRTNKTEELRKLIKEKIYKNLDIIQKRKRFEDWKNYLIAYDLKCIEDFKIKDIIDFLHPGELKKQFESRANKKILHDIKEAKRLINGEYKEYFF